MWNNNNSLLTDAVALIFGWDNKIFAILESLSLNAACKAVSFLNFNFWFLDIQFTYIITKLLYTFKNQYSHIYKLTLWFTSIPSWPNSNSTNSSQLFLEAITKGAPFIIVNI